jgi:hypothetical protein
MMILSLIMSAQGVPISKPQTCVMSGYNRSIFMVSRQYHTVINRNVNINSSPSLLVRPGSYAPPSPKTTDIPP